MFGWRKKYEKDTHKIRSKPQGKSGAKYEGKKEDIIYIYIYRQVIYSFLLNAYMKNFAKANLN